MSFKTLAFALALALGIGAVAPAAFANQPTQAASQEGNSNAP
jgi:hypothetical protein